MALADVEERKDVRVYDNLHLSPYSSKPIGGNGSFKKSVDKKEPTESGELVKSLESLSKHYSPKEFNLQDDWENQYVADSSRREIYARGSPENRAHLSNCLDREVGIAMKHLAFTNNFLSQDNIYLGLSKGNMELAMNTRDKIISYINSKREPIKMLEEKRQEYKGIKGFFKRLFS